MTNQLPLFDIEDHAGLVPQMLDRGFTLGRADTAEFSGEHLETDELPCPRSLDRSRCERLADRSTAELADDLVVIDA